MLMWKPASNVQKINKEYRITIRHAKVGDVIQFNLTNRNQEKITIKMEEKEKKSSHRNSSDISLKWRKNWTAKKRSTMGGESYATSSKFPMQGYY